MYLFNMSELLVVLCYGVASIHMVTVPTTTFHSPERGADPGQESGRDIARILHSVEEHLKQFNNLYLDRLDQKFGSIATNIATLDSNVKNIQARAHVWDTFQLHVSAWNEQIKSVDRKVDIINSGQEKLSLLDNKLNILSSIDYSQQRTLLQLAGLEARLAAWGPPRPEPALCAGFACRGVARALRDLSGRLDRLTSRRSLPTREDRRHHGVNSTVSTAGKKLFIRCFTPPIVEELVRDMSSKVDLMYDKLNSDAGSDDEDDSKNLEAEDTIDHDYTLDMYQSDEDEDQRMERGFRMNRAEARAVRKLFRHMTTSPDKKIAELREVCENDKVKLDHIASLVTERQVTCESRDCNINAMQFDAVTTTLKHNTDALKRVEKQLIEIKIIGDALGNARGDIGNVCKVREDRKEPGSTTEAAASQPEVTLRSDEVEEVIEIISVESTTTEIVENTTDLLTNFTKPNSTVNDELHPDTSSLAPGADAEYLQYCGEYLGDGDDEKPVGSVRELACSIVRKRQTGSTSQACNRPGSERYCIEGFLAFQSRAGGGCSFSRSWQEYRWGFGSLTGSYWLGLEAVQRLAAGGVPLRVTLESFGGDVRWAQYHHFELEDASAAYRLRLAGYSGNATDSLGYHTGARFSTHDQQHDGAPACCPCSTTHGGGGWWYASCFESNLNGLYMDSAVNDTRGIIWEHWTGHSSLRSTRMALKLGAVAAPEGPPPEDP